MKNKLFFSQIKLLLETIDAHEIESLSCDRDGNKYCECLRKQAEVVSTLLEEKEIKEDIDGPNLGRI